MDGMRRKGKGKGGVKGKGGEGLHPSNVNSWRCHCEDPTNFGDVGPSTLLIQGAWLTPKKHAPPQTCVTILDLIALVKLGGHRYRDLGGSGRRG